ncbi:unnamed protein product [Symbiodinium necroappetens]|uniref:J domain-containing protein n=1 Tax=Symbiodinium necroappetens TaxID=1628268 RepID=A0A812MIL2_9DINO|nr:unnamed protein product [Symbiodinium necroappetens]
MSSLLQISSRVVQKSARLHSWKPCLDRRSLFDCLGPCETAGNQSQVRRISTRPSRRGREKRSRAPKLHVVRFKLTQEDAVRSLTQHEQDRWMAPLPSEVSGTTSTALVAWQPDSGGVRAVFLPFRVVNAVVSAKYTGQVGYARTKVVTSSDGKQTTQTKTDYFWVRGSLDRIHLDGKGGDSAMQIYADFRYPEALLEAVKGRVVASASPFDASALNIKEEPALDPFRITVEGTREEAQVRMETALTNLAEQEMRHTHPGCTQVARTTIGSVRVEEYHVQSVYLPAYVFTARYGQRLLKRFVGGATGKVSGEQMYSEVKAAVLGLGVGLAGSFLASDMAALPVLAGPAAFAVAAAASLAGLLVARCLPLFRNWWFARAADNRASQHASAGSGSPSWEQSIVARHTSSMFGREETVSQADPEQETPLVSTTASQGVQRSQLVITDPRAQPHLSVLGLDLGCCFGRAQEAFRRQAMKLHPDHNPGASPEEREAMASKLRAVLTAYRELCSIVAELSRQVQLLVSDSTPRPDFKLLGVRLSSC